MPTDAILTNFKRISNFDFNLLFIFEIIYIFNSVSIASEKLNTSPSSVSQSLNKLRAYFSDPLFVRKGQGLTPTTAAIHLHETISNELGNLVTCLVNASETQKRNKFVIYSSSHTAQFVLPALCNIIQRENLPYELNHIAADAVLDSTEDILTYRKADLIFDTKPHYGNSIETVLYAKQHPVAVCSKNHPRLDKKITREDALHEKFTFLNINSQGVKRAQDAIQDGFSGHQHIFSSSCVQVNAAISEATEWVSFVTQNFFDKFGECYNLKSLEYYFDIEPISYFMSYNKSAMSNPNFVHFIDLIKKNITLEPDQNEMR